MKNLIKKTLDRRGFTLVELIVVIAIVAVLAVIGIPAIAGQVNKAQMSTATANAKSIATQAQMLITQDETAGTAYTTDAAMRARAAAAAGLDSAKCTLTTVEETVDVGPDGTSGTTDDIKGRRVTAVEYMVGSQNGKYTRV